ncbi:MAG: hypothetical protein JXA89_27045, partial [Anaerolineae bacterium]|nr:hypothetical protein [Anaerolineae bacterium]
MTFTTGQALPTVDTVAASGVTLTGATLNGTVNANNDSTTVTFEYGLDTSYGSTVTADQSPVSGIVDAAVSAAISGLTPGTLYHCRAVGQNAYGTTYGADMTFTTVNQPPAFSKRFIPSAIALDGISTLVFTIDNSNSGTTASSLGFTDNLPAEVMIATPANVSTTCSGGTLTAPAGSGALSYSGGSVLAGNVCTIWVDVTSSVKGSHVNTTGDLTSSAGNSGAATDTLTVGYWSYFFPVVLNTYAFAPDLVVQSIVLTNSDVEVIIRNNGLAPVVDDFWVDLYVNPRATPSVNQTWQLLCDEGVSWGVTRDIAPGEAVTLTLNSSYLVAKKTNFDGLAGGEVIYVLVDSANPGIDYGAVQESDETNNLGGPTIAPASSVSAPYISDPSLYRGDLPKRP